MSAVEPLAYPMLPLSGAGQPELEIYVMKSKLYCLALAAI